jgi:hypothetical protein
MHWKLIRLREAHVLENGAMANRRGEAIGLRVSPGGYMIFDECDRVVGTITLAGRVYDPSGRLITQVERYDLSVRPIDVEPLRALELGGLFG